MVAEAAAVPATPARVAVLVRGAIPGPLVVALQGQYPHLLVLGRVHRLPMEGLLMEGRHLHHLHHREVVQGQSFLLDPDGRVPVALPVRGSARP